MGSRYGGLKQMDGVGPHGETLLDYSVHDAVRCGFGRVVFVIRRDFERDFRERVSARFEGLVEVGIAFQELNDLPEGFQAPVGRVKPWGTGHAVWCARDRVDTPFLAINADDFYGRPAFQAVGGFLARAAADSTDFCMAGYRLEATLSPHGTVSRGVCMMDEKGFLRGVREHTALAQLPGGITDSPTGATFRGDERVSMNCWGLTPAVFPLLEDGFKDFLGREGDDERAEFYLPAAVASMIQDGKVGVEVLPVESPWFGVTYRDDRPGVCAALEAMSLDGTYPSPLV
jgi:hypothetical protein